MLVPDLNSIGALLGVDDTGEPLGSKLGLCEGSEMVGLTVGDELTNITSTETAQTKTVPYPRFSIAFVSHINLLLYLHQLLPNEYTMFSSKRISLSVAPG